ncbi:MAG: hypothetical protein E7491_00760 [Ruminococcaceae bacterium]|nr:hypothetical protein [Oscillospiraceae bacterium]
MAKLNLFSFFSDKRKNKRIDDDIKADVLKKLHGRPVKYVTCRNDETYGETILGRDGVINLTDDSIIVACGNNIVFRCKLDGLDLGELLALNGVNLYGVDETVGHYRHIVAYYLYHSK